jgi:hypothetical protein
MSGKVLSKKELHKKARIFVTDLLELGGFHLVHPSGMVSSVIKPDDPVLFTSMTKDKTFKLYTYSTDINDPDAAILNPFIEGNGATSKDKQIFYMAMRRVFMMNLKRVFEMLLNCCSKEGSVHASAPNVGRALQFFSSDVDETTFEEFKLLDFEGVHTSNGFVAIIYNVERKTSSLISCFNDEEEEYIKSLAGKIRKKTWKVFEKMLKCIFAVDDIRTKPIFTTTATSVTCPQFTTTIDTIIFGWNKLLLYLPYTTTDEFFENTTQQLLRIEKNRNLVPQFSEICLWLNSGLTTGARTDVPTTEAEVPKEFKSVPKPSDMQDLNFPVTSSTPEQQSQVQNTKPVIDKTSLAILPPSKPARGNSLGIIAKRDYDTNTNMLQSPIVEQPTRQQMYQQQQQQQQQFQVQPVLYNQYNQPVFQQQRPPVMQSVTQTYTVQPVPQGYYNQPMQQQQQIPVQGGYGYMPQQQMQYQQPQQGFSVFNQPQQQPFNQQQPRSVFDNGLPF